MKLTNAEIIREVERDIEAVLFNIDTEERYAKERGGVLEDYRKQDRIEMKRALALLDDLKKNLNGEEA